jgi:hypothetical protein
VDEVSFSVFEITLHVNLLFKLRTDQKNELLMSVGVDQKLLVTKLEHVRVLMINVAHILIFNVNANEIILWIINPSSHAIIRYL